jgi:hypothetical protein
MMKPVGMAIEDTEDADHLIDLQFGGADALEHLWALDRSVNRREPAASRFRLS